MPSDALTDLIRQAQCLLPRHVVEMRDFSREALTTTFQLAFALSQSPRADCLQLCRGRNVATLFYQPSTRTRLNFESAAYRLGATVVGFADPATTRAGDYYRESLADVVQFTAQLVDLIVIRHHDTGAAREAASVSPVPVISAGDGYGQHPTQALGDIWTMTRCLGDLSQARIGLLGDVRIRSLKAISIGLATLGVREIVYLPPRGTNLPEEVTQHLVANRVRFRQVDHVAQLLAETDLVETIGVNHPNHGVVRDQSRSSQHDDNSYYRITRDTLTVAAAEGRCPFILHPGPRTDEVSTDVDGHPSAKYFDQARNGMWIRMALLATQLADA